MAAQQDVDYKRLVKLLGEKETKVRYWRAQLLEEGLIEPRQGHRNKWIFSPEDVEVFRQLQRHLRNEELAVTAAIRLMKENVTPEEALDRYKRAQQEISALQKKVLALRQEPWWKRMFVWFSSGWRKLWGSTG